MMISSNERPNIDCGSSRFSQFCGRNLSASGAVISPAAPTGSPEAGSLGLEGIAGAAHGLEIAGIARVGLDLAPQTGHLHIDITNTAAERGRLRQILARDRRA